MTAASVEARKLPWPLRRASCQTMQLRRQLALACQWVCSPGSRWQHFELRSAKNQHSVAPQTPEESASMGVYLESGAGRVGLLNTHFIEMASGIAFNPQWPEETQSRLAALAETMWDKELALALGGCVRLGDFKFTNEPDSSVKDGQLFLLALTDAQTQERYEHKLFMSETTALACLDHMRWQRLSAPIQQIQVCAPFRSMRIHGRWVLGACQLQQQDLRSLRPGQAILFHALHQENPDMGTLRLGNIYMNVQAHEDDQWLCKSIERDFMDTSVDMDSSTEENPEHIHADSQILENLNVTLRIVCGNVSLPLSELLQLAPGQIMTLNRPSTPLVDIESHGQVIGHGELIQIEDQLAVEITALKSHRHDAEPS